jgi:hypothetical protein
MDGSRTKKLLTALTVSATVAMCGIAQSCDQLRNTADATRAPQNRILEQEIGPNETLVFGIGDAVGFVHFTSETDGLRLFATVRGEGGVWVRLVSTLAPDQAATVSMPGKVRDQAIEVNFLRKGEQLVVSTLASHSN